MGDKARISYPTNTPGISQFLESDKILVTLEDGRTYTLAFLLEKLVACFETLDV